jgi:hypothetical protein
MLNAPRLSSKYQTTVFRLLPVLLVCLTGSFAQAQVATVSALDRQLARVDLGLVGSGMISSNVSGITTPNALPHTLLTEDPTTTFGLVATLRYIKSPFVGGEFNYSYARFAENTNATGVPSIQTRANEYTFGYVAHLPTLFGVTPYASAGVGSTGFTPTRGGGLGIPAQARATYYYNVGVEQNVLSKHFGLRAQFRETFYKAPDFGQNYLTINQRAHSYEPGVGFFLRF